MSGARTPRGRQRKGRSFEREVVQRLWKEVGREPPWKKHARPDGGYAPPPEFNKFHLEIKAQERLNIWSALNQAEDDAIVGDLFGPISALSKIPLVVFSKARSKIYVALSLDDFLALKKSGS